MLPLHALPRPALATAYIAATASAYCFRRAVLHNLSPFEVLRRHVQWESGWPAGARGVIGFWASVLAWLVIFCPAYPLLAFGLRPAGFSSFFYYYPNANGAGLLIERLSPLREQVLRVDWHRFNVKVGKPGRPFEQSGLFGLPLGVSHHPPAIELNLPHLDFGSVRHYPWKQHTNLFLSGRVRAAARVETSKAEAVSALDSLHRAAARNNASAYLSHFAPESTFCGADATDIWPVFPKFASYVRERFGRGDGWAYSVRDRQLRCDSQVTAHQGGDPSIMWFVEDLWSARLGNCRGSGVLVRSDKNAKQRGRPTAERAWKVAQYSLAMAVQESTVTGSGSPEAEAW